MIHKLIRACGIGAVLWALAPATAGEAIAASMPTFYSRLLLFPNLQLPGSPGTLGMFNPSFLTVNRPWPAPIMDLSFVEEKSLERARPTAAWALTPGYLRPAKMLAALPFQPETAAANAEAADALTKPDWKSLQFGRFLPENVGKMIPRLKTIFKTEGVPEKWVWLTEVESGFDPRARSSSGAAGLFQLTPDTARRFGLRTFPFDDRFQPEKSARAAAQYLKFLHRQFGCWSLALAAYNAGEGCVSRTLQAHRARTFREVARHLPPETRVYVPRVMAIAALREDQSHGIPTSVWMP